MKIYTTWLHWFYSLRYFETWSLLKIFHLLHQYSVTSILVLFCLPFVDFYKKYNFYKCYSNIIIFIFQLYWSSPTALHWRNHMSEDDNSLRIREENSKQYVTESHLILLVWPPLLYIRNKPKKSVNVICVWRQWYDVKQLIP